MTPPPDRRPSMTDVARIAGVSAQTVSRVLNEPDRVADGTRERIRAAMRELGYRRNLSARALKRARSETIGLVHTGVSSYGPLSMLDAIERAARGEGLATQVAVAGLDPDEARAALGHLLDYGIDAMVVISTHEWMGEVVRREALPIPVVAVEAGNTGSGRISVVAVDQYGGARDILEHLYARGYRRIDHIAGPVDWFDGRERARAWRDFLADHDDVTGRLHPGTWAPPAGADYVERYADDLPDAVFVANDAMALGVLHGLWRRGIDVPGRVAVAGVDDLAVSAYACPPLTSMRQPFVEVGTRVVDTLTDLMAGEPASTVVVPATLVTRASTLGEDAQR
ncbi:LacI family DNA-binding transcriptional regulator [Nanchangia anserum]|uniref:LacI family DNA-binding transcriptional regulator n=1 Tax=Nanchangia anserum TaxID=2692125 RepID=A0A8I0GDE4_9ACTO|nr:LacI family DNA-binding transcriptional regulator [Nanchangia anserum]MBD3689493.1 LacI family DNA-binding transcriptional regulator [Nanchangia anserum]QOX81682.1 LacI family DNA-binding transcriptional regulator [Nanchangia anserum]